VCEVVIAEFPPFEQTVESFNGDAYVQARKDRTNDNDDPGMVMESGVGRVTHAAPKSLSTSFFHKGSDLPGN
jgi:hypothetical protein